MNISSSSESTNFIIVRKRSKKNITQSRSHTSTDTKICRISHEFQTEKKSTVEVAKIHPPINITSNTEIITAFLTPTEKEFINQNQYGSGIILITPEYNALMINETCYSPVLLTDIDLNIAEKCILYWRDYIDYRHTGIFPQKTRITSPCGHEFHMWNWEIINHKLDLPLSVELCYPEFSLPENIGIIEFYEYPRKYRDVPPMPHFYYQDEGIGSEFIYVIMNGVQIVRRFLRRCGNLSFPKGRIDNPETINTILTVPQFQYGLEYRNALRELEEETQIWIPKFSDSISRKLRSFVYRRYRYFVYPIETTFPLDDFIKQTQNRHEIYRETTNMQWIDLKKVLSLPSIRISETIKWVIRYVCKEISIDDVLKHYESHLITYQIRNVNDFFEFDVDE